MMHDLEKEAQQATRMLSHKVVHALWRHRPGEVVIQFADGTRLFIDRTSDDLELSITEGMSVLEAEDDREEEELHVPVKAYRGEHALYAK